jgi:hypothetical protein
MKAEDIERLKDICAKEGFDLIKKDGRYYIQETRNRVVWHRLYTGKDSAYSSFNFQVSKPDEIKYLKEELEAFLTVQLEKFLNNEVNSVIVYPKTKTSTT